MWEASCEARQPWYVVHMALGRSSFSSSLAYFHDPPARAQLATRRFRPVEHVSLQQS